jgi:hypothetical protein
MTQTIAPAGLLLRQHAPVGSGQGLLVQVVPAPRQVPWQFAWVVMVQPTVPAAVMRQHAPVITGCGQVSLPQVVPPPRQAPVHWDWVVIVQTTVPVALLLVQHAPVTGGVHKFVVHTVLLPL